jgi:hypothetical protein
MLAYAARSAAKSGVSQVAGSVERSKFGAPEILFDRRPGQNW